MDGSQEKRLIAELTGKFVGGWEVIGPLGAGKSAVVFSARRNGEEAALKIFSPDLIERSGRERQLKRIERELALKHLVHPNLVRVKDGGECTSTGYLFIAMERIDAPNLATVLPDVPREAIRPIVAQIADAARFLESLDPPIAHRDIKPDNIAISPDFKKATLLDLGVILPIDLDDKEPTSDEERRFFVGTLRYGPPEFLVRKEEYSVQGWRAVTFYQLGALLYDLIMRERIFEAFADPYPRLVMAVEHEIPNINAKEVPEELILLAKNCLHKDPLIRLNYVSWSDFELKPAATSSAMTAKERVRRRLADCYVLATDEERAANERERSKQRALQDVMGRLHSLVKAGWVSSEMFCPIECNEHPSPDSTTGVVALRLPASKKLILPFGLSVWFIIRMVDERSLVAEIDYVACLANDPPSLEEVAKQKPKRLFAGVFQDGVVQADTLDLLYQLVDLAQSVKEGGIDSDTHWLDLVTKE